MQKIQLKHIIHIAVAPGFWHMAICILLGNIAVLLGNFKIQTIIRRRKSLKFFYIS